MEPPSSHDITQLLRAWTGGDQEALEKLTPLVYQQLHRVAQRYMARQRPGHTLQASALVNEVYLRLVDCVQVNWQDRAHFLAVSAQLMRRILIDFAAPAATRKEAATCLTFAWRTPRLSPTNPMRTSLPWTMR
jgi:RNA polymerase sigma factor (TIGR02999 family)